MIKPKIKCNLKFKNKYIVCIFMIVISSLIIFFSLKNNLTDKINQSNEINQSNLNNLKSSNSIIFNLKAEKIKDRYTYIKDESNIYIGNNLKELENDYYDFKLVKDNNDDIVIYLNKLFINYNEKSLYDEKYIIEILLYINRVINNKLDLLVLKDDIEKYYLEVKNIHNEKDIKYLKTLNDVTVEFFNESNMLVIKIKLK